MSQAREHEQAGRPAEALAAAWRAFDRAPDDRSAKRLLVGLLHRHPELTGPERRVGLERLIIDPEVDPSSIARAAWHALLGDGQPLAALAGDARALAQWGESEPLPLRLLEESPVAVLEAERALTGLRRWLLLSGRWAEFPRLVAALTAQAAWNGGAWLIEADEAALLAQGPGPIAGAYFPTSPDPASAARFEDRVTAAVAEQYERWPYPPWSRVTMPRPKTVPAAVQALDGGRESSLPVEAELLIAGCGTGRETAFWSLSFPDARVTAIDISEASLSYARERCRAIGLERIAFRRLELQRVAELGKSFDFIGCSGVLHHLPDPEEGWASLAAVLAPGGVMHVMLYSKIARLAVRAAQRHIADLHDRPVDPDLLRAARRRLIERAPRLVESSADFYTLAGIHDLLLHRHEDPFDVPRIVRGLDRLGLELLAFRLPTPHSRARYAREHPHDPAFRDVEAWAALERSEPFLFSGMYDFWCRRPAAPPVG